jgi:murein DD-endopeptidase MepM/ murein hydrolase activator NlpD
MLTTWTTRPVALCLAVAASALALAPGAASATSGTWVWPADGAVLRAFALGDNPYAGGQHRGIDIALGGVSSVRAPASGEVTFAGQVPTHGLTVTIATADGHKASLTHLGPLLVKRGARVVAGASIAASGSSGTPEYDVPYIHL